MATTASKILNAAKSGQKSSLAALLADAKGLDLSIVDDDGNNTLMFAAQRGYSDLIDSIVKLGVDINKKNKDGKTALMSAAQYGQTESVRVLRQLGADVNARDKNNETAIVWAAWNGYAETVKVLQQLGADVDAHSKSGDTALMNAAINGHTGTVKVLHQLGADMNAQNDNGKTALLIAADKGHTETVKVLAQLGADLNAQTKDGWTAPMLAASSDKDDTVKALHELGADLKAVDQDGWNALMVAAQEGHTKTVKVLHQLGVNVNAQRKNGWTAVMSAAKNGQTETVKALRQLGADLNLGDKDGSTALLFAAKNGKVATVKMLHELGADVNIQNKNERTALMSAADAGQTEVVRVLKQLGANLHAQSKDGWTAVMLAASSGHTETVKVLHELGANVKAQDPEGWNAMMIAAQEGHTETVKVLHQLGVNVNVQRNNGWTALMSASKNGHTETMKALQKLGADVNAQNKNGRTALMSAADGGHTEMVKVLKQLGADVNIQSEDGWTALMLAASSDHADTVKVLHELGANPNAVDQEGWNAMMVAAQEGHTSTVKALHQIGVNVNAQRNNGWTALMSAAKNGHNETLRVLRQLGADPNLGDKDGDTALMSAASNGHTETVKVLHQLGADVNAQNDNGRTALMAAANPGHTEIVKVLHKAGADVNVQNKNGRTAIMIAADKGRTETVKLLHQLGADVNGQSKDGWTVLMLAASEGHTETVQVLHQLGALLDTRDEDGWTALMIAAQNGHAEAALLLHRLGADLHAGRLENGRNCLMVAAQNGHSETVRALHALGIDINAQSKNGNTALHVAGQNGHAETVDMIFDLGANVNAKNKAGQTALILAAKKGHTAAVEALLKIGVDRNLRDDSGNTAAESAASEEIKTLIQKFSGTPRVAKKRAAAPKSQPQPQQSQPQQPKASNSQAEADKETATKAFAESLKQSAPAGKSSTKEVTSTTAAHTAEKGKDAAKGKPDENAMQLALKRGSKAWGRIKVNLGGQGRAGKTAFANAAAGRGYTETASTVGINQLTCDVKIVKAGKDSEGQQVWDECAARSGREYATAVAETIKVQQHSTKSDKGDQKGTDIREHMRSDATTRRTPKDDDAPLLAVQMQETSKTSSSQDIRGDSHSSTPKQTRSEPAVSQPKSQQSTAPPTSTEKASIPAPIVSMEKKVEAPVVVKQLDEETVMKELAKLQDAESGLLITLFDFGGQAVFDVIHHLFLTRNGVYALMFNMEWMVTEGPDKATALSFMRKWLSSIAQHTLRDGKTAPVVIVGTRFDRVQDPAVHERISTILYDELHDSLAWPSVVRNDQGGGRNGRTELVFFPVDNTKGNKGPTIKNLLSKITSTAEKTDYTQKEVPLTWFKAMDQMSDTKRNCMPLSEVHTMLRACGVSEAEVPLLLTFLHDMGHLMWLDEPGLRDVVILDPVSYLVTPATVIICKLAPNDVDSTCHLKEAHTECLVKHRWEFDELLNRGLLGAKLLPILWKDCQEHTATLLQLMVKFGLLVPLRNNSATGAPSQYLVPTLLSPAHLSDGDLVNWTDRPTTQCYFVFTLVEQLEQSVTLTSADLAKSGFLPGGMFERMVGKALSWSQDTAKGSTVIIDSVILHKDVAILSFGQQRFRLVHCADIHCVRVDVEGSSPLRISDKLLRLVNEVIRECMGGLHCFAALRFETEASDEGNRISTGLKASEMLIPLVKLRAAATGGTMLTRRGGRPLLTVEEVKAKYRPWLQIQELRERYDAFISYRWGTHDSKFAEQLYDMMTNYTVGTQIRAVEVFLDRKRLQEGRLFRQDFAAALTHSLIALPVVSVDALQRMIDHSPDKEDNVLLEWVMVLESHRAGNLLKVYPVLFGAGSGLDLDGVSQRVGDFFAHSAKDQLPKVTPTATLAQAAELLRANGIQPSEKMQSYTVHSVVQELLQFLLCKASDFANTKVVEAFAEKVVHLLEQCGSAALDTVVAPVTPAASKKVRAESPVPSPTPIPTPAKPAASTPTPSAGNKRPLKELTVAEVGELMVRCELEELQPIFAANKVKGRRLMGCDTYTDLMEDGLGVPSKAVAKELMSLIEEWKEDGVPMS